MTGTITPYRSELVVSGNGGFGQLLHSEWTKFRTVRGWVAGIAAAAVLMVLISVFGAFGSRPACGGGGGGGGAGGGDGGCHAPLGPDGEAVQDGFYFVNQPLVGDGGITVRLTSLTGLSTSGNAAAGAGPLTGARPEVQPWSKAGIIIKESTAQGSGYAAIMLTGGHGVRMQYDYTHDTAGSPGGVSADRPRWLRLTRAGDAVTGYESADGGHWSTVGTVHLRGLGSTVQAGLFVTSPDWARSTASVGGVASTGGPTRATGVFDQLALQGSWPKGGWTGTAVGGGGGGAAPSPFGGYRQSGGAFTVDGSGDIAPAIGGMAFGSGQNIERSLVGTFAGLIAVTMVGTLFITAEYRRGLIRTTLAAGPGRGRMLAAKAVVLGALTFATGLAAATAAVLMTRQITYVYPVDTATAVRVVLGTAGLLAVTAVLALAVGTVLRRSAGAVTLVVVAMVLPYILATASVLPAGPSEWLLRLTPAAGFAIQQSLPVYPQVDNLYTPANGYFPLEPWAGFGVLCGYTALALALAVLLLRRRDVG